MKLVGVDGCRAGWVAAVSDVVEGASVALSPPSFSIVPTFAALLAALQGQRAIVAVDIPIGLPSGAPRDNGRRRVDEAARRFLGSPRSASVFSAPCRPTLTAGSYREACEAEVRARSATKGLSQQAYRIIPKIREVDEAMTPAHQAPVGPGSGVWVREVHPEVVFAALSGDDQPGHGLVHSKRRCNGCRGTDCPGESERLALLHRVVPAFDPVTVRRHLLQTFEQPPRWRGSVVGRDDIVDAVACLVAAFRIANGQALTLPSGDPECDARGLRMEILA
jgi:predicted RNase H-like nuclease